MNSFERVIITLDHKEPDMVPVFPFLTIHGSKELGLSIQEYFSHYRYIVEGQKRLHNKYQSDCILGFTYAAKEAEAFGGDVIFSEDGPPNAGESVIKNLRDIETLQIPIVNSCKALHIPLMTIKTLYEIYKKNVPIIGYVVAPLSLPIILMGFEQWLETLFDSPSLAFALILKLKDFTINWANAQLSAGASAIGFLNPLASSEILTREMFLKFDISKEVIQKIQGPVIFGAAAASITSTLDLLSSIGLTGILLSSRDRITEIKQRLFDQRITIVGNLNNISMIEWTPETMENEVKKCIKDGGKGGGYIISDQHGEIPYQVSDEVIHAMVESARKWGKYPLDWIEDEK